MKCAICQKEFSDRKDLHLHVSRQEKVKLETYYLTNFPRFDLYTKELIEFKNWEFYIHAFFNNRKNLICYYKNLPKDKVDSTTTLILKERKEIKNLILAPSTVDTRLATLPSPLLVETYGGDYNRAAKNAGLEPRYDYNAFLEYYEGPIEIIADTKEQKPLNLSCKVIRSSLDFGDYACKTNYNKVFIERKSLCDLSGSLSAGYERLLKEFARAKEMDATIVVLVEEDISGFLSIGYTPQTKHIKSSPEFLGHRIREIYNRFDKVQFLFANGRKEAARLAEKIFRIKNEVNKIDLEFLYNKSIL